MLVYYFNGHNYFFSRFSNAITIIIFPRHNGKNVYDHNIVILTQKNLHCNSSSAFLHDIAENHKIPQKTVLVFYEHFPRK